MFPVRMMISWPHKKEGRERGRNSGGVVRTVNRPRENVPTNLVKVIGHTPMVRRVRVIVLPLICSF